MTRQEEGRRPSLGNKEGAPSPVPKSSKGTTRGAHPSSASLTSSPTKLHHAPSLVDDDEKRKKASSSSSATTKPKTKELQDKDKEKAKGNDAESPRGAEKKELKSTRRPAKKNSNGSSSSSSSSSSSKTDKRDEKGSEENDDVEEEEEKSADESEEESTSASATTSRCSGSDAHTAEEEEEEDRSSVGSGGLFFLRRRKSKAKAKQQEAKQREALRSEKRQQLIKLKRLVEGDAAPLHVEFEIPGAECNVEFVTKKAAACAGGKSKEEHSEESTGEDEDEDADSEETTTPKERRKNSLGSFGYGLWVPPSGRSRRAMTDSELVITERPEVDVPMRRKGSLTKGPLVTAFALQRKSSDNSKSPSSKEKLKREKSHDVAAKDKEKQKEKESDKEGKEEEERKKKLRNLSRSAPAGPASMNVLSEEDEECDDDEEDEDEEEGEEFEDEDDEDEDVDDERACRYNQDLEHQSSAYRSMSKEGSNDEELVPRQAYLDVVLMEAKDLLVLNKRAMRKLFKYKLFSPFLTVSVGQNTTRTKRTTTADPTFNDHLTFVYQEGGEENPMLTVKLFYRCRTKAHRMRRLHVGTIEVPLTRLIRDKTHDMWLPIIPTCDYQLLWNWQKLGNDASNDVRDARVSAKSKDRSRTRLGSVHLTVHKSLDKNTGALRSLGLPSLALPLRLKEGDVILFHCSQLASHGAKLATRSRWDHVAMVAKHRKREGLYLFEATRDGVHLFNLDRRLAFYLESRTELGVRRLRTDRTKEMEDALHDFVAEVDGRPYKTNPLELLRALRDSNECDNLDTIFCSQLVAAAYQRMGILSQELCSNNYLPADFATTKISDNLIGAELDDVVLVMPVRQKGALADDQPFSGVGGSAPGSFQIGSLPF